MKDSFEEVAILCNYLNLVTSGDRFRRDSRRLVGSSGVPLHALIYCNIAAGGPELNRGVLDMLI